MPGDMRPHFTERGKAKRRFASLDAAQTFARRQGGSNRRPYHGYECPVCSGFHVGRKRA